MFVVDATKELSSRPALLLQENLPPLSSNVTLSPAHLTTALRPTFRRLSGESSSGPFLNTHVSSATQNRVPMSKLVLRFVSSAPAGAEGMPGGVPGGGGAVLVSSTSTTRALPAPSSRTWDENSFEIRSSIVLARAVPPAVAWLWIPASDSVPEEVSGAGSAWVPSRVAAGLMSARRAWRSSRRRSCS